MSRITSDLKQFGRKSPLRCEPVPLERAIANARALLEARLTDHSVWLTCRGPSRITIVADMARLEQVLVNLISNALDATPENSEITISVTLIDGDVEISVIDNGPGLSPDALQHAFEPFYTTKPHGIGLGLAISYQLLDAMGGTLRASNMNGHGAKFTVRLPASLQ